MLHVVSLTQKVHLLRCLRNFQIYTSNAFVHEFTTFAECMQCKLQIKWRIKKNPSNDLFSVLNNSIVVFTITVFTAHIFWAGDCNVLPCAQLILFTLSAKTF
jgi:hypothetical protein